jgi:hypothetical protein
VRTALQRTQLDRMADELPLPQIELPYRFTSELGPGDLDALAGSLVEGVLALPGAPVPAGEGGS